MITKEGHIIIATVLIALFVTLTFVTFAAAAKHPTSALQNPTVSDVQQNTTQSKINNLQTEVTALEHIIHISPGGDICIGAC